MVKTSQDDTMLFYHKEAVFIHIVPNIWLVQFLIQPEVKYTTTILVLGVTYYTEWLHFP